MSVPFTAARARNAGFEQLRSQHPQVEYVQFIDGDCVIKGWIQAAAETLDTNPEVVAVWLAARTLPERSIYNRICDVEWRMGSVRNDAQLRRGCHDPRRSRSQSGYDSSVIAAEDDELSVRLP